MRHNADMLCICVQITNMAGLGCIDQIPTSNSKKRIKHNKNFEKARSAGNKLYFAKIEVKMLTEQ